MEQTHPLRAWRKDKGKSLEALATDLGVTPSHLSQIECGKKGASLKLAMRISEMTAVPVQAFGRPEAVG